MDVARALSGEGGHRAVRDLLLGEGRGRVLELLAPTMAAGEQACTLRLQRAHFKPGRKLTAVYLMREGGRTESVPVGVRWTAGPPPDDEVQLEAAEARLRQAGVPTRPGRLWAVDRADHLSVLVSPLDPTFPALGALSAPDALPSILGRTGAFTVRPIRYRPGERHVLLSRAPRQPGVFAKLYKPGQVAATAGAVRTFAELVETIDRAGLRGVRPAKVLDADADAIVYDEIPEPSLAAALARGDTAPHQALHDLGAVLRVLHDVTPSPSCGLPERDVHTEAHRAVRACEAITALRPELGALAHTVVTRAHDRIAASEPEQPGLVHGDLKADHVYVRADGVTLIDTDRSARADAALDLGKLLADLRWRAWCSSGTDEAPPETDVLDGYGGAPERIERAQSYAALFMVKAAARRISLARRDWASSTGRFLAAAERALERVDVR